MPTDTIPDFLKWAASSAGLIAVASFLIERVPWFQSLLPKQRQIIIVGLVILLPQVVLVILRVVPPTMWETLQPYWAELVTSLVVLSTLLVKSLTGGVKGRMV